MTSTSATFRSFPVRIHTWRIVTWLAAATLANCALSAAVPCRAAEKTAKKVIEWGWDEPDTAFIREHITQMEEMPFDGLVFHANSSKKGKLTWEMWGQRQFELSEFEQAVADLQAISSKRLTDNFLRVNVTPGSVDWFDDEAWSVVLRNYSVAAQIARAGRCRGFMFDVEQYNAGLFDYTKQPHREQQSFAQYQARVRECGRQWMRTVNDRFPDITVLMTFGYRIAQPPSGKDRSTAHYGLLADFLDGMLDACSEETTIVDACEFAYPYKKSGTVSGKLRDHQKEVARLDSQPGEIPPMRDRRIRALDGLPLAQIGMASG